MNENDLSTVLRRATESVEVPHLSQRALTTARRRRTRRRGAVAGVVSVALVATAVVGSQLGGRSTVSPADPAPPASRAPEVGAQPPAAPPIDPARVQSAWDPADVIDLPQVDLGLPAVLDPVGGPGVANGPGLAVADLDGLTWVLDATGEWTSTRHPEPPLESFGRATGIASAGAEVAFIGVTALWRRDVSASEWREVDYPDDFRVEADWGASASVYDDGRILLTQYDRFWLIDPDGAATRLPFDELDEVVPAGDDVLAERFDEPLTQYVEQWRDGEVVSSTDSLDLQSLQRPVADAASIAVTRARTVFTEPPGVTESDGLLALDRDGLTTRAFLPVPSTASYYSDNGGLTPLGWLDPDTVLVAVQPRGDADTTWLVTWDVATGDLARAASYATGTQVDFAVGAL